MPEARGRWPRWLGATLRWSLRSLLLAALAGLLVGGAALWLALEDAPAVPVQGQGSLLDLGRAMRVLHSIDPRRDGREGPRELLLSQDDLALVVDQAAQRMGMPLGGRVTLAPQQARLQFSLPPTQWVTAEAAAGAAGPLLAVLAPWLEGRWLNLDLQLRQAELWPEVEHFRVGRLPLPAWAGRWALNQRLEQQFGARQWQATLGMVTGVTFTPDALSVSYHWKPGSLRRMLAVMVPQADQARLRLYLARLSVLQLKSVAGGRIPMVQLLPPVFELAQKRSAAGADAREENRAALLALAFAPFPRELVTVLPAARFWRLPPAWPLSLQGRRDFPLHFLISAALAAEAGGPFADAVGVFKEVLDARGTSGFSFNDIAADRAGTRLGLLALREPQRLQAALAAHLTDDDLLPDIRDLPESLRPEEFTARFGAIGSPAYARMLADIEARLDRVPLYR